MVVSRRTDRKAFFWEVEEETRCMSSNIMRAAPPKYAHAVYLVKTFATLTFNFLNQPGAFAMLLLAL